MKNCISYPQKQFTVLRLVLPLLLLCAFSTSAQCPSSLENTSSDPLNTRIQFSSEQLQAGGDSATVVGTVGNCGLQVINTDTGQPWARASISIDLGINNLNPGDQIQVSADIQVNQGFGQFQIVRDDSPNTTMINLPFSGSGTIRNQIITIPSNALNSIDIWLFSNFGQSANGGDVVYSNIDLTRAGGGSGDCSVTGLQTEYRVGTSGAWPSGQSSVTVDPGAVLTLSGVPNSLAVTITDPAGVVHDDNYQLSSVSASDAGVYIITESGGCFETLTVNVTGSNQPPTAPGLPTTSNITSTAVNLSWAPSTDDAGVSGYRVFSGANLIATSANTNQQITGLSPNTSYDFSVRAFDAVDAESASSGSVAVTTLSDSGPGNNIAQGKIATQSSTYGASVASNAVDGNTDGNGEANVTHTQGDDQMWWKVDLGARYSVSQITLFNRTDCCGARLIGAELYVGDNGTSTDPQDFTQVGSTLTGSAVQDFNGLSLAGRYVMVHLLKSAGSDKFLSLAEVEVYGSVISDPGPGNSVWTASNFGIDFNPNGLTNGNVGIGTQALSGYRLAVDGKIRTREVRVDNDNWADYVFKPDYELPSLEEVKRHIDEKGHLINIPSAKEVHANGFELGEMNRLLLEKIEELTLYMIEQDKQQKALERELTKLEKNK